MVSFLINKFVKDKENINSVSVRAGYATVTGVSGVVFNIFLFIVKCICGLLSSSISIISDAFNNLSDAGTSLVTMIGFRIANSEPDEDHPYGHGRSEYIAGLIIGIIILLVGVELIKSSIEKIINPENIKFSGFLVLSLVFSIVIKFYMYIYNKNISLKLDSAALFATAKDSINDVFITLVVLVCSLIDAFYGVNIDGICGLFVGIVIIKGGIDVFKDTSGLLLGRDPGDEYKEKIKSIVLEYDAVLGVHDLMIHDYGPGRQIISLHAEVPANGNILELHDTIDIIERRLSEELKASATIHMDPIVTDDKEVNYLREIISCFAKKIEPDITVHDFRVVKGNTHTNLIFDIVLPFSSTLSPQDAKNIFYKMISEMPGDFYGVITVDRP